MTKEKTNDRLSLTHVVLEIPSEKNFEITHSGAIDHFKQYQLSIASAWHSCKYNLRQLCVLMAPFSINGNSAGLGKWMRRREGEEREEGG